MNNQEKLQNRIKMMKGTEGDNFIDRERRTRNERLKKQRAAQLRSRRYQSTRTSEQKTQALKRASNKLMKAFGK